MWHEKLKKIYSKKTFGAFEEFMYGKSFDTLMNEESGNIDWFYSTADVMAFEMEYRPNNSERAFPQKG